jgi:hypothetical protein
VHKCRLMTITQSDVFVYTHASNTLEHIGHDVVIDDE